MPQVISPEYLDTLLEARDYYALAWISAVLCGCGHFDRNDAAYGLPLPLFGFVERLVWFAQGIRSSAWTYFESTSPARQHAMLDVLRQDELHPEFAAQYAFGSANWREPSRMTPHDAWLDANDELNNAILWQVVSTHRDMIQDVSCW